MELTGEEMSQKIALSLGYKFSPDGIWSKPPDKKGTIVSGPHTRIVPSFHKSLDLMFEARMKLSDKEKESYQAHLRTISPTKKILDATARDHAEAYLEAKGLWAEEPIEEAA